MNDNQPGSKGKENWNTFTSCLLIWLELNRFFLVGFMGAIILPNKHNQLPFISTPLLQQLKSRTHITKNQFQFEKQII